MRRHARALPFVAFGGLAAAQAFAAPKANAPASTSASAAPPASASAPASVSASAPASVSASAPASASASPRSPASALERAAGDLVSRIASPAPNLLVASNALKSDEPLTRADELLFRVLSVIAGKLPSARVHREAVPLATARALAGRTGGLVYVDAAIDKGKLRVALDVYPPVSNAWERWKNPSPEPSSHQFVEVPIDAEIRSFLPPILLERAQVHRMRIDDDVAALGCGDVDGDGGIDLVVVSDKRVAVGHAHANRFVVDKSVQIARIAARAPVPLREPIASVVFDREGESRLWLGTTDVGGVSLDATLARRSASEGIPFATARGVMCATPSPETSSFEGPLLPCVRAADGKGGGDAGAESPSGARGELAVPAQRFDAYASFELVARDGASRGSVAAAREPGGRLRLSKGDATAVLDGVGADLALFDLDQDGVVELVSSQEAGDDAISIVSWDGTSMRPRLRIPAAAGVRALTVCPPESHGAPFIVAAVGNEVWLVR